MLKQLNHIKNLLRVVATMVAILCFHTGCKEKYLLPAVVRDSNYLVVEGFINNGIEPTIIRLSRTVKPQDTAYINPEQNASVSVAGEDGTYFYLPESEPGVYTGGPFNLNPATRYSLEINTTEGKHYASEPLTVKTTPPIDSISWIREPGGVRIYANTHDATNQSIYYAWQFEETWEFFSLSTSAYQYDTVDSILVQRTNVDSLYRCWQSDASTSILIGSSAKLSSDVIHMAPLTFIEQASWKISSRYSILTKQRVLDKNTFEYFEKMKKNSEQLGSIFDPLPSTSAGNIKCTTDPLEVVIGQAYISSTEEKRIFIQRSEVGDWRYRMNCQVDTVENKPEIIDSYFSNNTFIVISEVPSPGGAITAYLASTRFCMDCRSRGVHRRPDFW